MWSAIIQEYPSIYQQGLELAKRLRLNDRKIARALDKNLKYFGDQWFGDKWRSILLSTDTPEHVEESRARQTALNEHADQEAAFVWTLVTVLSQYKRGMYLSHVGGLNYALVSPTGSRVTDRLIPTPSCSSTTSARRLTAPIGRQCSGGSWASSSGGSVSNRTSPTNPTPCVAPSPTGFTWPPPKAASSSCSTP